MLQNCKLNFKKLNGKHFSFYCLISVLVIKCCFCTMHLSALEDGKQKVASVNAEEIIRRRSVIETYLKEKYVPKDDWIETYHGSFSRKSVFTPGKTKQEYEHGFYNTFSFQNMDLSSVQNPEDSDNLHESLLKEINSDEDPTLAIKLDNLNKINELSNSQKKCTESFNVSDSKSKLERNLVFSPISSNFKTKKPENSNKLHKSSNNEINSGKNPVFKLQSNSLKKIDESSNNQKNWIETYHFSYSKSKLERNSDREFCKAYSQERVYIIRWINKLQNKLKDSDSNFHSLSILISVNLHKLLSELSQEFDIVMLDELVNNIISNATLHNNFENTLNFNYKNVFKSFYLSLNYSVVYICMIILFFIIFLYSVQPPKFNNFGLPSVNFVMHYKRILFSILLSITFSWHAYKMYQLKLAEKHSVMSRVVPSYCENILHRESGIFAYFKEYFRWWWHDEDCKKYYEAVMVDPVAEITLLSVSIDLLSDVIFQILRPIGHHMNSFFKVLTYELSFTNKIFVIILTALILIAFLYFCMSFVLAYYCKFRINFPFFLGSAEPTRFSVGSRVEEIEDTGSSLKDLSIHFNASLVNYENKKQVEDIYLKENSLKTEPKYCAIKATRTRCNSI